MVGYAIPEMSVEVDAAAMGLWALVLRDPNPIHRDIESVRSAGLGDRVINQGPANVAYLVNAVAAAFPGSFLERIDVRFLGNVCAGDIVTASGVITAVDGARLECDLRLSVAMGEDALTGTATVMVASPESH